MECYLGEMFVYKAGNKLMAIEWERINMFNDCFYNSSLAEKNCAIPSMENAQKLRYKYSLPQFDRKSIWKIKPIISGGTASATSPQTITHFVQQIAHFSRCVYKVLSFCIHCVNVQGNRKSPNRFFILFSATLPAHPPTTKK